MNKTLKQAISNKWLLVLNEYELIKQKKSKNFKTIEQLCNVFKIHRKDIRKYYERWMKSGKNPESLMPLKRGPRPGQLKILSKDEERTIIKIRLAGAQTKMQKKSPGQSLIPSSWLVNSYQLFNRRRTILHLSANQKSL